MASADTIKMEAESKVSSTFEKGKVLVQYGSAPQAPLLRRSPIPIY